MSIFQATVAPDVTSFATFCKWATVPGSALAQFGWVQAGDTGQVVWPATIIAITNAVAAAGTVTFTYTSPVTFGNALVIGSRIVVTGCTTAGLNTTYTIVSLPSGTSFTAATGTTVTEVETATGRVDPTIHITNAAGNGVNVVFTYTVLASIFQGPGAVHAGQSIVITGCTTGGFNVTATITAATATTFTIVNNTNVTEAEPAAAIGEVTSNSALPGASTTVYEVWRMADSLQASAPIFMKMEYGETGAAVSPSIFVTVGHSTDGAGAVAAPSTGQLSVRNRATVNSTSATISDLSGDTSRFQMAMWHTTSIGDFFSIERAHDASGNDVGDYFTAVVRSMLNTPTCAQVSVPKTGSLATSTETRLAANVNAGTGTGSFANSTLVSPIFPLIGAVGNPMIGVVVGKTVDFTDATTFNMTMYGVSHVYLALNNVSYNASATLVAALASTCMLGMRYE